MVEKDMNLISRDSVEFVQDFEGALLVLKNVRPWMPESGMNPSKYWHPDNMNRTMFVAGLSDTPVKIGNRGGCAP